MAISPSFTSAALQPRRFALWGTTLAFALAGACNCEDDLDLLPGDVEGIVCSAETGQPLQAVGVTVTDGIGEQHQAATDLFGTYLIEDIPAGDATLSILADDGERLTEIEVPSSDVLSIGDDNCRPPPPPPPPPPPVLGNVAGCICDEERFEWVSEGNVFINGAEGELFVTGTDEDGCFVLENVPVGTHVLKVQGLGSFYVEHDVVVAEGETTEIESPETCEAPPEPDPPQPEPQPDPPPPATGEVAGRVCAPDGETWLADAEVSVTLEDGTVLSTSTNGEGRYLLEDLPEGEHTLTIVKGSFTTTIDITIVGDERTEIPEDQCELEQDLGIAVVAGEWDDVRSVLLNVGIDAATITDYPANGGHAALLTDYEVLSQYDIVFFNCGAAALEADYLNSQVMKDNLRAFVEAGGSVYASDQAYDIVEQAFPEKIEFLHDDLPAPQRAQFGHVMEAVPAQITDLALATAMGTNSIELHYPLSAWAVMRSVASDVRVFIRGNADVQLVTFFGITTGLPISYSDQTLNNVPHTVSFNHGEGSVVFTSFHQEPGINLDMERVLQLLVFEL